MPSIAPKAFRCTVYDEPATLGKVNDVLYVFYQDGRVVVFEVPMAPFTCVLGEVGLADTQQVMDRLHGSYAAIACSREEGVQ